MIYWLIEIGYDFASGPHHRASKAKPKQSRITFVTEFKTAPT